MNTPFHQSRSKDSGRHRDGRLELDEIAQMRRSSDKVSVRENGRRVKPPPDKHLPILPPSKWSTNADRFRHSDHA
jgi:hypothetical protein